MLHLIVTAFVAISTPAVAEPISSTDVHVIDGDTIRVHHRRPDVRLVGFNAPETQRAQCEAERQLGANATRRLRELVHGGDLDLGYQRYFARVSRSLFSALTQASAIAELVE